MDAEPSGWSQRNAPWIFAAVGFGFFLIGAGDALPVLYDGADPARNIWADE